MWTGWRIWRNLCAPPAPNTDARQIVQERHFSSDGSVNCDFNLDLEPVSAFQDKGAQVFDAFPTRPWEPVCAVLPGHGSSIDPSYRRSGLEKYCTGAQHPFFSGQGSQREALIYRGCLAPVPLLPSTVICRRYSCAAVTAVDLASIRDRRQATGLPTEHRKLFPDGHG